MTKKTCICDCGNEITVPFGPLPWDEDSQGFDVCNIECPECGRVSDGGNFITGEVSGWVTRRQLDSSLREFERQRFSAEMNEWEGRGNHPF
jgi:hypothetical protein